MDTGHRPNAFIANNGHSKVYNDVHDKMFRGLWELPFSNWPCTMTQDRFISELKDYRVLFDNEQMQQMCPRTKPKSRCQRSQVLCSEALGWQGAAAFLSLYRCNKWILNHTVKLKGTNVQLNWWELCDWKINCNITCFFSHAPSSRYLRVSTTKSTCWEVVI